MSIMDKFSTVEIKADNRISDIDQAFCLRHQEAFDKAGPALLKIAEAISAASTEQFSILGGEDNSNPYLSPWGVYISHESFKCSEESVCALLEKRNKRFIHEIVNYFSRKYTVELDESVITGHLIPSGPQEPKLPWGGYREMTAEEIESFREMHAAYELEKQKHDAALRDLPLRYERIVEEIFVQLGGFSFQEKAMNEFLEKCWNAVHWNTDKERFEIKNDTIKLDGFCYCDKNKWMINPIPQYKPSEELGVVLDALVHHSVGQLNCGAKWFPELHSYHTEKNVFPVYNLEKVKQIRLFQNGRVDIKFRDAVAVQEFVANYLRKQAGGASSD